VKRHKFSSAFPIHTDEQHFHENQGDHVDLRGIQTGFGVGAFVLQGWHLREAAVSFKLIYEFSKAVDKIGGRLPQSITFSSPFSSLVARNTIRPKPLAAISLG